MFTVTKTTQGAYTAYVPADTGAGTTATVVPERGRHGDELHQKTEMNIPGCGSQNFSQPGARAAPCPCCFPCAGARRRTRNTFGGKSYPMIIHGIVHSMPGQVVETAKRTAHPSPCASRTTPKTRKAILLRSALPSGMCSGAASCALSRPYENTGSTDMPFSFGFHPYFRVSDVRNLEWDIKSRPDGRPGHGRDTPFEGVDFPP